MDRDEVHQAAADLRDALNPPRIMMAVDVERTLSKAQRIVEMTSPSNGLNMTHSKASGQEF